MKKMTDLNLPMRTEAIIASVILGRETTFADHDEVLTDDVVARLSEISERLSKKQKTELVDALRMSASDSYTQENDYEQQKVGKSEVPKYCRHCYGQENRQRSKMQIFYYRSG